MLSVKYLILYSFKYQQQDPEGENSYLWDGSNRGIVIIGGMVREMIRMMK